LTAFSFWAEATATVRMFKAL